MGDGFHLAGVRTSIMKHQPLESCYRIRWSHELMSLLLLSEWGMSEIEPASLPITSLSHTFVFPFVSMLDCAECLPPTIHCTSTLRRFFSSFFFLKGPPVKGGWSECVFPLLCNIIWVVESRQSRLSLLSLQPAHLCLIPSSRTQKTPSNSCGRSFVSTAVLPVLPKAIANSLLSKPGRFCAVILIGKIRSMVIFCIWRIAVLE